MRRENKRKNGIRKRFVLTSEDGSVMIVALALLMLLTLIGISATTTSMIEIQIAGAKKTHTDHLFLAEGAAMQCVQTMQNDPDLLTNTTYVNDKDTVTNADIGNHNFTNSLTSTISSSGTTGYAAINQGVVGSLKMGQPNLHAYTAYGWQDTPGGLMIVELGYRRAF
jgi:Tfp pilus assembly protein PilX